MPDTTTDKIDEDILVHDVSDEMLEIAGTPRTERASKTLNGWLYFC